MIRYTRSKGMSMQKNINRFSDALEISLRTVPVSNPEYQYVENTKKPKEEAVAKVEKVKTTEAVSAPVVQNLKLLHLLQQQIKLKCFNGKVYRRSIWDRFYSGKRKQSSPYAVFTETSKQGVYRVKMENGATALVSSNVSKLASRIRFTDFILDRSISMLCPTPNFFQL